MPESVMKAFIARSIVASLIAALAFSSAVAAQPAREKPQPDEDNVKYGPHERNVLDLWKAPSESPTPLVVFIHGGGFSGGSKEAAPTGVLNGCLRAGISVAAINYRLSPQVKFPAHYLDCARAIQFLRSRAKQWNLDPTRVGATGGSAGAGTSLWIGFHDDMADPKSDDPVLRESTRLTCMAVVGAQSTYDPRAIKELVGGRAHEHGALLGFYGLTRDQLDTPEAHRLFEAAAPITHLGAGDPPVYAFYSEPKGPLPPDAKPGEGIHHPNFGVHLKKRMDELGIECIVRHRDETPGSDREIVDFFVRHLTAAGAAGENAEPAPIQELPRLSPKPSAFDASSWKNPLVLRSQKEAAEHFGDEPLAALAKQVDFERQIVLLFAWQGSGQDRLEFAVAESAPEQVVFSYKAGRTRDLREHVKLFALRKNVAWSVKPGQ
jgi:acetyl esterase/lipase